MCRGGKDGIQKFSYLFALARDQQARIPEEDEEGILAMCPDFALAISILKDLQSYGILIPYRHRISPDLVSFLLLVRSFLWKMDQTRTDICHQLGPAVVLGNPNSATG